MQKLLLTALLLFLALVVSSCTHGDRAKYAGWYKVDPATIKQSPVPEDIKKKDPWFDESTKILLSLEYNLKPDGTISTRTGDNGGRWDVSGLNIILMDQDGKQVNNVQVTVDPDGHRLHFYPVGGGDPYDMVRE